MTRNSRFSRFLLTVAAIASAAVFVSSAPMAQDLAGQREAMLSPERLIMRNTTAASAVARNANWASPQGASGFTDSSVFRRGATTRTVYDTTIAYAVLHFALPPHVGNGQVASLADTVLPWIVLKVGQDTTAYSFAGTSGGVTDTIRVAIESSEDGVNWFSFAGTPTYRFDTVFLTSGQDGLQSPTLYGVEISPGQDFVTIPIKCALAQWDGVVRVMNKTACCSGVFLRFVIGGAYSGQYKVEAYHWQKN
jgi:hypothetical protein